MWEINVWLSKKDTIGGLTKDLQSIQYIGQSLGPTNRLMFCPYWLHLHLCNFTVFALFTVATDTRYCLMIACRLLPERVNKTRWSWPVRLHDAHVPTSVVGVAETNVIFTVIMKIRYVAARRTQNRTMSMYSVVIQPKHGFLYV